MRKKIRKLLAVCMLVVMVCSLAGCGSGENAASAESGSAQAEEGIDETGSEDVIAEESGETEKEIVSVPKNDTPEKEMEDDAEEEKQGKHVDVSDLKPSEGLEFESNGDGTCTITGIGVCTDTDLVIPEKSPNGDTVTLIEEYAFFTLEDVESVTLVNCDYEIAKNAFQYGEFATLYIIGGSPVFKDSSFSACEDLTSISFSDCNIDAGKYSFFGCGKDMELTFTNCTGMIDEYAFQYGEMVSLTMNGCELEIDKSAFSACEDLTSIIITDSTITAEEYAFFGCGDKADVEMTSCSLMLDDRAFQYSSLNTLTITGPKVEMGDSTFSACEDLATISIDCASVILGEYAFYGCEDLTSVSICDNASTDNEINIDDRAFQYCDKLEKAVIGNGTIDIGKYVFSECADALTITVAGQMYTMKSIEDGISQ